MTAYATALLESPKDEIVAEAVRQKTRAETAEADLAEARAVIDALEKEATRVQVMLEHLANEDPTNYEKTAALIATDPVARAAYIENGLLRQRNDAEGRVSMLENFAYSTQHWRRDCWDHDDDMGHDRRDFSDEEEWDRLSEQAATLLVVELDALLPAPASEGPNKERCGARHPEIDGVVCNLERGHEDDGIHMHVSGRGWKAWGRKNTPAPATEGVETNNEPV